MMRIGVAMILHFQRVINPLISDNSKLDFIFEFAKNDFSKLELNKRVYSREYFVADVAWKLGIIKRVHKEKHVLGTFVCVRLDTEDFSLF